MNASALLLSRIDGYKTYVAVIIAIVSGLGMILSHNCSTSIPEIFQALTLVFSGASIAGLRHAVAKVPTRVVEKSALQH
jgi:hypothetical protein